MWTSELSYKLKPAGGFISGEGAAGLRFRQTTGSRSARRACLPHLPPLTFSHHAQDKLSFIILNPGLITPALFQLILNLRLRGEKGGEANRLYKYGYMRSKPTGGEPERGRQGCWARFAVFPTSTSDRNCSWNNLYTLILTLHRCFGARTRQNPWHITDDLAWLKIEGPLIISDTQ